MGSGEEKEDKYECMKWMHTLTSMEFVSLLLDPTSTDLHVFPGKEQWSNLYRGAIYMHTTPTHTYTMHVPLPSVGNNMISESKDCS